MIDKKIIQEWVDLADEDYGFAFVNLKEHDQFYSNICFHFHQAGEKYLKAYIIANELSLKRIHNLRTLLDICRIQDKEFDKLKDDCISLNVFYIDTRCPTFYPTGRIREEAEKARQAAKKIGDFVKNKLTE